ncbi:class A beta-lactamase [Sphingomonas sp. C3-2]|uniref:class A beta-lactamase n=1 Tax=Sphingomonas sp. C3-2 TaxID=3062169 RepID=UPI00294B57D5|nr:class A beta-lactamase [Sphingomonas sp. C3-2]WOK36273.1 class A beta-lactamase [Sphingomonas sp. C3-2]
MKSTRRQIITGIALLPLAACATRGASSLAGAQSFEAELTALERASGGRLGVCLRNTATGEAMGHRASERFALCSTFKLALAAMVLKDIDDGVIAADLQLPISEADMVPYAPVSTRYLATGRAPITALARAAQVESDNVAANLILRQLGGPAAYTRRLRALGDDLTRLDRTEPDLNHVLPGDARDTTTPAAMAKTMQAILLGNWLSPASTALLWQWMRETQTGLRRLRGGLPTDWAVGDKTGTAAYPDLGTKHNDVAMIVAPSGTRWMLTAYFEAAAANDPPRPEDDAVLAAVARAATAVIMG